MNIDEDAKIPENGSLSANVDSVEKPGFGLPQRKNKSLMLGEETEVMRRDIYIGTMASAGGKYIDRDINMAEAHALLRDMIKEKTVEALMDDPSNSMNYAGRSEKSLQDNKPVIKAPEIIIGTPEKKFIEIFDAQYRRQVEDLKLTGQANERMPDRTKIIRSLTPDVLILARNMEKMGGVPTGLLVADNSWNSKAEIFDAKRLPIQRANIIFANNTSTWLWNNGEALPYPPKWRYLIVDGNPTVENFPEMFDIQESNDNYLRTRKFRNKYLQEGGLDIMTGASDYLSLVRLLLLEGKIPDTSTFTVLNGKNIEDSESIARGSWCERSGGLRLDLDDYENTTRYNLRVRAAHEVKLPVVKKK